MSLVPFFAAVLAIQLPFDEAEIAKHGFVKLDEEGKPSVQQGAVSYRRAQDQALLRVTWLAVSEEKANKAWRSVLANMAGRRAFPNPPPPSGKSIGDDWLFIPGNKEGGVWRIDALRRNTYVSVMLHYASRREGEELRWQRADAGGDGELVETLVRAIQAKAIR